MIFALEEVRGRDFIMSALKDIRIISLILVIAIGVGFESLRHFEFENKAQDEIGKAGEIFSIHRDSTRPLENKALRRPKNQIQKLSSANGVKFDLKAAITNYQKEHGLEEHEFGAKKTPDKLKDGDKKKKKKTEYEYVFDRRTGKWIKRKKLTPEQREELLARRHAKQLEAEMKKRMEAEQKKLADNKPKTETNDPWSRTAAPGAGPQDSAMTDPNSNENDGGFEKWMALINERPEKATIYSLLNAYRNAEVSFNDLMSIARALVSDDQRPEFQELGLIIVDETPSAQSFQLAVSLLTSADPYGDLRTRTQRIIEDDYASVSGLGTLQQVMRSHMGFNGNPSVLYVATKTLESAIRKLLSPAVETSYVSSFTPFVDLLTDLSEFGEPDVNTLAQSTLALLQSSLGPTVAANHF